MQNNILFFQSTCIGGVGYEPGLFEILLTHLDSLDVGIFEQQQIIVPTQAMAVWLKDQIAIKHGICANLDCVVLPSLVLDNIYYANNPECITFNFSNAKYIIYDYLCNTPLNNADELNNYIYVNGELDLLRVYQLATQLHSIFYEYMYLRTEEMLNLEKSRIKPWQQVIIRHLLDKVGTEKTFLDVYLYFMQADLVKINLPANLFIFGLNSICPSQLKILAKLSNKINLYWYYQAPSYKYYGDLLSDKARNRLGQKLLRKPELNLDDLYLQEGNLLLANLAQQSREFTELLIANDIDPYMFKQDASITSLTLLQQIQEDIRNIIYRIEPDFRFSATSEVYANPLAVDNKLNGNQIYDLPAQGTSIKVNICHNRMREVQVMFNEVMEVLDNNPQLSLNEILITAPDIDAYAPYIEAVFDNESINQQKLSYNITGQRKYKQYKILETLKIILSAPYTLNVNYLLEILVQSEVQENLGISSMDIELIKRWLHDNKTHFGYDAKDYEALGYQNYQVHSFKQFLINIALGACISENVWHGSIPLYPDTNNPGFAYIPYDNIDNNQVGLCNKLILLIGLLEELRDEFYADHLTYKELTISQVRGILLRLGEMILKSKNSISNFEIFMGELLIIPQEVKITLPILKNVLDECIKQFSSNFMLNGSITCASMRCIRNIPYKFTYILGLNFGEYPGHYTQNQLSLLATDWYLADRNYNIEDKQAFLDIILSCQERIYFSYIGRRETDNSKIKPSPLLDLFINTLGQSFSTFKVVNKDQYDVPEPQYDFKNLVVWQPLHPFYNNHQPNYSKLWFNLANSQQQNITKSWDFNQISPVVTDFSQFYNLTINDITKSFLYTNANLYRVLQINRFNNDLELSDSENISLADKSVATGCEKYLKKYSAANEDIPGRSQLRQLLINSGTLAYEHIGRVQFEYYYDLYSRYTQLQGSQRAHLDFSCQLNESIMLTLHDEVWLDDKMVIITDSFTSIFSANLANSIEDLPYQLKIRGIVTYLLCYGGGVVSVANEPQVIDGVIIRQININGESTDFKISLANVPALLNQVLRYYVRSLANPVLIHKGAIEEYAKCCKENKPYELCLEKARAKYTTEFENKGLEAIREDLVFKNISENYFEFIQTCKGVNDIARIGEILAKLY